MKLIKATQFRTRYFESGSEPDPAEAVKYVRADTLPVVTDNGKVNVGLIAENERLHARVAELESDEQEMAGDNNV